MDLTSAHNQQGSLKWKPFVIRVIHFLNEFSELKKKSSFNDLQINEITQYALVFCLFKKPQHVSYKRNRNLNETITSLFKKVSSDYEDMQKTPSDEAFAAT